MSTLIHRLAHWAETEPHAVAQAYKQDGVWKTITTREYMDRVFHVALFLESKGFKAGDISAILSYNCPQWVHFDLAPSLIGSMSVGLYPNAAFKDLSYILEHTEARVLAVQNKDYYKKALDSSGNLPGKVELVVVFDGDTSVSPKAISYDQVIAEGAKLARGKNLKDYLAKLDPLEGAFVLYTSGTTGSPKGAIVTHDSLAFCSDIVISHWKVRRGSTMFSFLPVSHIAEKLQNLGVGISAHCRVNFCSKFDNLIVEIQEIQPTVLLCVPRVWEKMMEGVMNKLAKAPPTKKKLAEWAFAQGAKVGEAHFGLRHMGLSDWIQYRLAEKLVLGKVRHALGMAAKPLAASGAAPLPAHVAKWFRQLGVYIEEDYGQTESTALLLMTTPGEDTAGAVGRPAPGTEVKLAADGEIICRGRHVFKGYLKDDKATQGTVIDGWLHTGDLGKLNEKGQYMIVGRKKEIMKTSGGKMSAPLPIEEALKVSPLISQACMVGDNRKYFNVLITLSETALTELKDRGVQISGRTIEDPEIVKAVQSKINEVNASLSSFEQLKYFKILAKDFTIEAEEMTPTMKMKRSVVERNYKDIIDSFYGAGE